MKKPLDIKSAKRPYALPPSSKALVKLRHCYEHRIACGLQMRGDDDNLPVLIYYGAPFALLLDAMKHIGMMLGKAIKGYVINSEHSCRYKNGKAYHRIAVEIHGLDEQFISIASLISIINNYMQRICWCSITELPLKRLLNL